MTSMTRRSAARRPAAPVRQISIGRLVRVELLKLTTARLSYGLLAASVGITVLWNVLEASRAGKANGPAPLNTYAGLQSIVTGGVWGLIFAAVLGVIIASGEFRHLTATLTYLTEPARGRVLAAKMAAAAAGGAVFGLAGYAVACAVGLSFAASHGYGIVVGGATFANWGVGHMVAGALLAAIGVVVGSLVRSQLAGVIGVFVWSIILESLLGGLFKAVRPYLPYTAATTLSGTPLGSGSFGPGRGAVSGAPLPFAAATALLAVIALAGALLAARTTLRRDIT